MSHKSRGAFSNGTWSLVQHLISTAASSLIALLLVLVLPVSEYGVYAYAAALVAIGMSVTSAGLSGLAVKALVNEADSNHHVMVAILFIRESFALASYGLITLISLTSGTLPTVLATLVAGLALFARAGDAPEFWFKANMRIRTPAVIRISTAIGLFAVRLIALWLWPSLWLFLVLFVLESVATTIWIFVAYLKDRESPGLARFSLARAVGLLRQSYPLAISSVANEVNLRSSIIILQALVGSTAVGVYAVAAKLTELALVLPVVFMNATLPVLLKVRNEAGSSHPRYHSFLQRAYDQAFWLGIAIAGATAVAGAIVIDVLLGPEYAEAKYILWVSLISCPFVYMAAIYSKWIIAEGTLWASVTRHGLGAVVNVSLNFILVPQFGIIGSAVSTVISYFLASYMACFVGKSSRLAGMQMTLAFVAPLRYLKARLQRRPMYPGLI